METTEALRILEAISVNGIFTTGAAGLAGIHRLELQALRRAGYIEPMTRGVWRLGTSVADEGEHDHHVRRTLAHLARMKRATAADGPSALLLHGLPVVSADLSRVYLVRGEAASTRCGKGYSLRTYRGPTTTTDHHPLLSRPVPVVPVEVAIVSAGLIASPVTALAAADHALRLRVATAEAIETALTEVKPGAQGVRAVRRALQIADARRESAGESYTAWVAHLLGLALVPQVTIGRYRVDFVVEGTRVIVEFDGAAKYASHDDLLAEKRREDELRAMGYVIVRLMWSDLERPDRARAKIERALAIAS